MTANEVRHKFLRFFENKGHKVVPSSSLVPENDPSVLFTTAGMQQFKPYYTAPGNALKDFGSKNVASVQKCIRTGDIEEVGDDTHLTFFEMLGNFSFGGYWKKEAIEYAHEFITKELSLEIDYVTIFRGENGIPKDDESGKIWRSLGITDVREEGAADVFWGPTGEEGPCGPTTEIYINGVEIWNIVFNEYYKTRDGKYEPLQVKGIDTGMGLERLLVQVQKKHNVYETDLFLGVSNRDERISSDHIKASLFMTADGVIPGNTGRGYVLRRLIRRAARRMDDLKQRISNIQKIYAGVYPLFDNGEIEKEVHVFEEALRDATPTGIKWIRENHNQLTGEVASLLTTSYGVPLETAKEISIKNNFRIHPDIDADYAKFMKKHQELSRTASAGMFKGGLANHEPKTVALHTAHHLLLAALQNVIDPKIKQRGSNITEERLRMDFSFDKKLTDDERRSVEDWVNDKIKAGLSVTRKEMPLSEAQKLGAEMEFGAKYPEIVSVYFIQGNHGQVISKEFCGGPHVSNTLDLNGTFKILKDEAVSAGVRRIKAVLI